MNSLADELPPEIANQIHPDWRKNEAAYWEVRDLLLEQYRDQWIGFADGCVIACGRIPVEVFHQARNLNRRSYVTCVGQENEPTIFRRVVFPYGGLSGKEPLPRVDVEFRTASGSPGRVVADMIPDTGADGSILSWAECQQIPLDIADGTPSWIRGVSGGRLLSVEFQVWAYLDGAEYECKLQADMMGDNRLLGRDVLNRLDILFRGPAGEVVINP